MKTRIALALMAILTSSAFAAIPAVLPEFKNAEQLAEWRAEMAAKAESKPSKLDVRSSALDVPSAFYTGKPYIESTGSYAFKYRSYNPELARWTTEDPSGFPDGANCIVYSRNMPISGLDADGLIFLYFHGGQLTAQSGQGYQQNGSVDMGEVLRTWGGVSGPFGNGAIPNGWYSVTSGDPLTASQRDTQNADGTWDQGSMSVWLDPNDRSLGNIAYKYNLDPIHNTDVGGRDGLRIHPDGPPSGTEGCIGITTYNDCVAARSYINSNLNGLELYVE